MKAYSRWIVDTASACLDFILAAASARIRGFSSARTSIKFLLGVTAVSVPLLILLLQPSSKAVGVIFVTTITDPLTAPPNGACSLREAIENVNDPGVDHTGGDCSTDFGSHLIEFQVSGTITLGNSLPAITGTATIDGTGQSVSVDGASLYLVLTVNGSAALTINDLTIAHGSGGLYGGGVYSDGTLTVTNCTFSENTAQFGGGIAQIGPPKVTISNSAFTGNSATAGGGAIGNLGPGNMTISSSTFSSNNSPGGTGGAIFGAVTVDNSTFSNNSAGSGGAIFCRRPRFRVGQQQHLLGNSAPNGAGGAIFGSDGFVGVSNSTFSSNSASEGGGVSNSSLDF